MFDSSARTPVNKPEIYIEVMVYIMLLHYYIINVGTFQDNLPFYQHLRFALTILKKIMGVTDLCYMFNIFEQNLKFKNY